MDAPAGGDAQRTDGAAQQLHLHPNTSHGPQRGSQEVHLPGPRRRVPSGGRTCADIYIKCQKRSNNNLTRMAFILKQLYESGLMNSLVIEVFNLVDYQRIKSDLFTK